MSNQELNEIKIDEVDCRAPVITGAITFLVLFCYILYSSMTAINKLELENTDLKKKLFEQRINMIEIIKIYAVFKKR
jgi:hypothetical protein